MSSSTLEPAAAAARQPFSKSPLGRAVHTLASLRLTVVLFSLSMVLVFVGTLAQMDEGIGTVVGNYFRSWVVWVPGQLFVRLGQVFLGVSAKTHAPDWLGFPFPGGWTIGTVLLANLLAAHISRFRLSWRRSGILILHAGLIVLLTGELVTGLFSVESRMTLSEGETAGYIENNRSGMGRALIELAITDVTDPTADDVFAVPAAALRPGNVIRGTDLPVDVEVLEYLPNSAMVKHTGGAAKREVRTSTVGIPFAIVSKTETAGADTEQPEDAAAGRVRLLKKGTRDEVGTFLVSLWYDRNFTRRVPFYRFPPQTFVLDGRTYTIDLRNRREYLPYSVKLLEFRHDRYIGTDTPKNYSSLVRLDDPERGEDREVLIYMNHPLRRFAHGGLWFTWFFNGETFYQSGFLPPQSGVKGTVLQVVRNPGWLMPYLSCILVSIGMMIHFGIHLFGFLVRRFAA
ncbi:MAG TPA: hypothetical protein VL371_01215 [Gemmataceae bacterium]|nr:hypothetical protein [Gemmataceae bacterium]